MDEVEQIRKEIKALYHQNPNIHVDIATTHPKLILKQAPARIMGVYANVFRVQEMGTAYPICHSLQYADVLIGRVKIHELNR